MLKRAVFFGLILLVFSGSNAECEAQQLVKTIQDYCLNPFRQFQPDDPQTRSVIWNWQAGRTGLFFPCEEEEQKRYSPYIYWKYQTIDPIPPCPITPYQLNRDWRAAKQRIIDGCSGCSNSSVSMGPTSCNCVGPCAASCSQGCQTGCSNGGDCQSGCSSDGTIAPVHPASPVPAAAHQPPVPPQPKTESSAKIKLDRQVRPASGSGGQVGQSSAGAVPAPPASFGERFATREGLISVRPNQRSRSQEANAAPVQRR
ncbi:MAG: hypothetical protein MK108_00080 [Mariniblastus sp.]|nr:hypothetical protein [Mariniblastus sp.]